MPRPRAAEEMLDGQHQRVDVPAQCRSCSRGPPAEKTGRGPLLNRPSCSPDDLISQENELNWKTVSVCNFVNCIKLMTAWVSSDRVTGLHVVDVCCPYYTFDGMTAIVGWGWMLGRLTISRCHSVAFVRMYHCATYSLDKLWWWWWWWWWLYFVLWLTGLKAPTN